MKFDEMRLPEGMINLAYLHLKSSTSLWYKAFNNLASSRLPNYAMKHGVRGIAKSTINPL